MTEFNKSTCVKVNKEKMDLIKAKGLNLQNLLDKAMDEELKHHQMSKQERINDLTQKIEKIKKQRDDDLMDYQKKIDSMLKMFNEIKNKEEKYYNKQIKYLELELNYLKNNDK